MNAQKRSPATLAEYLKSAEAEFWYPEQTAFVLRHIEQIEAVYRQLLSGKPLLIEASSRPCREHSEV